MRVCSPKWTVGLEDKPVSVCPLASEPGPQKAPIIVDPVIVIAIGQRRQTIAPESADAVTLPAPLGFVNGASTNGAGCSLTDSPSEPGCQPQCACSCAAPWLGRWLLLLLSVFFGGNMCSPGPSLPGPCLSHWLLQRSVLEAIATGSAQCPLGHTEHVRWLLALEGV